MTTVDTPALADAAGQVEPPSRLPPADRHTPGDRLGALADWWAAVSAEPSPRRAVQLWAAAPAPVATPEATVSMRSFEAGDDVHAAVVLGLAAADEAVDDGTDLVLLSVPAQGVAAAVLAAHLLGLDAVDAQGWPRAERLSDDGWTAKVARLRDGRRRLHGAEDADEIAARLGDPGIAAGTAVLLRCAARRTPVLVEGLAGAVCGLLAQRAARTSRQWWLPADGPAEGSAYAGLHDRVLTHLRHEPLLRLGLPVDDGTGVRLGLTLLETALA
jgi:nicotinate-nucleotide--dimethylbenzimidazole phosphoribosyltransferase